MLCSLPAHMLRMVRLRCVVAPRRQTEGSQRRRCERWRAVALEPPRVQEVLAGLTWAWAPNGLHSTAWQDVSRRTPLLAGPPQQQPHPEDFANNGGAGATDNCTAANHGRAAAASKLLRWVVCVHPGVTRPRCSTLTGWLFVHMRRAHTWWILAAGPGGDAHVYCDPRRSCRHGEDPCLSSAACFCKVAALDTHALWTMLHNALVSVSRIATS